MSLATVPGQPRAIETLRAALRSGSVHHAYLFTGPEGVGKEATAIAFVQALYCPVQPKEGCGTCPTCLRIERGNHPDVTWVLPEEEQVARGLAGKSDFASTPSRGVKVEQVRALQERLALHPLEAELKIALLLRADRMNDQAQNALLKTLEEPPPKTVLVLVASAAERLLPTIHSRCSRVHFGPLPRELVASIVQKERKLDDATAQLVAGMAEGSLTRARALDVEGLARRRELVERFEALDPNDARTVIRFAEEFGSSRADVEDALQVLGLWTRDVGVAQVAPDRVISVDLRELAEKVSGKYSAVALQRRRELLAEATEALERNASPRMQLEKLLFSTLGMVAR